MKSPPWRSPKVISCTNNNLRRRCTNNMGKKKKLSREDIMSALADALTPRVYVHAFWEGGSPGYGRFDGRAEISVY